MRAFGRFPHIHTVVFQRFIPVHRGVKFTRVFVPRVNGSGDDRRRVAIADPGKGEGQVRSVPQCVIKRIIGLALRDHHAAHVGQGTRVQIAHAGAMGDLMETVLGGDRPDLQRLEQQIIPGVLTLTAACRSKLLVTQVTLLLAEHQQGSDGHADGDDQNDDGRQRVDVGPQAQTDA